MERRHENTMCKKCQVFWVVTLRPDSRGQGRQAPVTDFQKATHEGPSLGDSPEMSVFYTNNVCVINPQGYVCMQLTTGSLRHSLVRGCTTLPVDTIIKLSVQEPPYGI